MVSNGMQSLVVYFMVQRLGFSDTKATLVWSAASALIYVSPAFGGWIGDQVLGTKRTMLLGSFVLIFGYALMTIPTMSDIFLYCSLGVIVVGNGLFKPNAGNLIRKIYHGDNSKIDSAFTMYYMTVNIGSTITIVVTPMIKEMLTAKYGPEVGWHGAFSVSVFGLMIGLLNYSMMRHSLDKYSAKVEEKPINMLQPRISFSVMRMHGCCSCLNFAVRDSCKNLRLYVYDNCRNCFRWFNY